MNEAVTHRRVVTLAFPVVLSNATVPILGLVDSGVVGQIDAAEPLAAVGVGALLLTTLYWFFGFLRLGTVGFAAQALGKGDENEAAVTLSRALLLAGASGVMLIVLQWPIFWLSFQLGPVEAEVEALARDYMGIRIWSAPALIATYALNGMLVAQGRTWALLVLQVWMNGVNIVLDLWFVLGLGWGIEGVAIATFIAEWSGAALGLWLCRGVFVGDAWNNWTRIVDPASLRRFASVNRDIFIRSALLQAMFFTFLLTFSPRFGTVTLAANQVLLQFLFITSYAMDGFTIAAETLVGRAFGSKSREAVRRANVITFIWVMGTGAVFAISFWAFGPLLIEVLSKSKEVQEAALLFLPYMILAPLVGGPAWHFDGVFIGATRSRDMRNMMIVSSIIYYIAAYVLMDLLGNDGLWMAFLIAFLARGITLATRYPALERAAED